MRFGKGNGTGDGTEGAYNDTVFGTYMHGPVMARNPQIADLLLKLALDVNALPPVDDRWYEALRSERIAAAHPARLIPLPRGSGGPPIAAVRRIDPFRYARQSARGRTVPAAPRW